jgi:hypothetical protein
VVTIWKSLPSSSKEDKDDSREISMPATLPGMTPKRDLQQPTTWFVHHHHDHTVSIHINNVPIMIIDMVPQLLKGMASSDGYAAPDVDAAKFEASRNSMVRGRVGTQGPEEAKQLWSQINENECTIDAWIVSRSNKACSSFHH